MNLHMNNSHSKSDRLVTKIFIKISLVLSGPKKKEFFPYPIQDRSVAGRAAARARGRIRWKARKVRQQGIRDV
ncbi:hypothetical protein BAQ46_20735 [Bacillus paranthracis]|nr:hypothetical protein BAQ46_20735 [Bacillus paranthracis]